MDSEEREIDFREADRRYAELKRQLDAGSIDDQEFDAHRRQLMVQDHEGRWWAKSRETGEWRYRDGWGWTRGTPPGYQTPPTFPAEDVPESRSQLEQGGRLPPSRTPPPGSAASKDGESRKQRRDVVYGAILTVGILVAVGMMLWRFMPGVPDEGGPSSEEASGPAPGYELFEHDSGALSVEVPVEWDERASVDSEGEKGRAAWSSFLGEGESAGPSMTAVNDLESWRTGTVGHQGIYMVASKKLAQGYTDEELVASGPNDYSSSCKRGTIQDFERSSYSGKLLQWESCGGDSEHTAITLSVAPEGRECVIVAQIGGYFRTQADEESIQHVLDTLETDCSNIG